MNYPVVGVLFCLFLHPIVTHFPSFFLSIREKTSVVVVVVVVVAAAVAVVKI
jgi:hypothetical protein